MSDLFNLLTPENKLLIFRMMRANPYPRFQYSGNNAMFVVWPSGSESTLFKKYGPDGVPVDLENYEEKCEQARKFAEFLEHQMFLLIAGDQT